MKKVQCFRTYADANQTLGVFVVTGERGPELVCRTLELPDKQNASNISRIPEGEYKCKYTQSASLKDKNGLPLKTYEILNVPKRGGVRIHSGNFASQIRGCILLGAAHKDINDDGNLDVIHSGQTLINFEQLMEYKDFTLEIIDAE